MAELLNQIKKSEEDLIEANATKDKFFSIIAHDLKNPLHAIVLSSDLLISKFRYMDGEQLLDLIKNINRSGVHLSNLLGNLLTWSRTQSGKIEYEPNVIDLLNLVLDNINLNIEHASKKNITLNHKISEGSVVFADYNTVSTVLRNLISNAIKFSFENSEVLIYAEELDKSIAISIHDNGVGISEDDIQKLFRIDIHHTTMGTLKEIGTGLGLILCKEFVELNGGSVWVKSDRELGTTFTFTLPKNASLVKNKPSKYIEDKN
jgi:signal transduction histidine kinase